MPQNNETPDLIKELHEIGNELNQRYGAEVIEITHRLNEIIEQLKNGQDQPRTQ